MDDPDDKAPRYTLGAAIGEGGVGEVVAATDQQLGREVAIKRMRSRHPSQFSIDRFVREARIQGRLDHPAIPPVHELGTDADGRPYFAMKKLTGKTLADVLAGPGAATRATQRNLLRAFADVCLAVELAHTRGVVHRDLKPANIMVGDFGEVYVLDWGAAKVAGEVDDLPTAGAGMIGTPGYAAPEQAQGHGDRDVDARADVYSLGAILFEILAGQALHPRGADGAAVVPGAPRPTRRAPDRAIPPELDELCARAIAVDPANRIASARALADGVLAFLDGDRDAVQRGALAREHLAKAQRAFASRDEAIHATAMREAGRALALDPELHGAAELVTRIMLDPPRATPESLADAITADRLATVRRMSRAAFWSYIAYLVFAPAFLWLGAGQGGAALVLMAIVAVNAAVLARQGFTPARPRAPLVAIGNAILIGLIARLWGPLLAAPGVAAITTMVSAMSPLYRRKRWVAAMAAMMVAAILAPLVGEALGWLSPTIAAIPGGFELTPPGLNLRPSGQYLVSVMFITALVAAAAALGYTIRGGERSLRERLLRIAWQLRQLVPATLAVRVKA